MRKTCEKYVRGRSDVNPISVIYSFKQEQYMNTVFKDAIVAADDLAADDCHRADADHPMQSCAEGR